MAFDQAPKIAENERTATAQAVSNQPDGPGKRIGKRGELFLFGKIIPGSAELFRERLPQFQAEANYWETRVGTVHDFRFMLFDNDTRILFSITYDGDFKPYIVDIIREATPWFDALFPGVWEGYTSGADPKVTDLLLGGVMTADFFYCAHPDVSVRDLTKMKKVSQAVSDLLDAAS